MAITKTQLGMLGLGGGSVEEMLRPVVTWFLDGCPAPRPATVDELLTALVIIAALLAWHTLYNRDPKVAAELVADAAPPQ